MASNALATSLLLTLILVFFITIGSSSPTTPSVPMPPPPRPPPPSSSEASCPMDALKLRVCARLLNSVNVTIGSPPTMPCCSLIKGLVDLEAAACLCTAIKANVLGINLDVPLALSIILNNCGMNNSGFQCKN